MIVVISISIVLSGIVALIYMLKGTFQDQERSSDMSEALDHVDLPSVYINPSVLGTPKTRVPAPTSYVVNGQVFEEDVEDLERRGEELVEFIVRGMEGEEGDMYVSTPSGSESECGDTSADDNRPLSLTLQPAPSGYIVNGSGYLTWQQWNTLVTPAVTHKLLQCVACEQYCEAVSAADHVSTAKHRERLLASRPLDKYDLSIVRRIRNKYHCAVCNETFDLSAEKEHFAGKMHEGNLLFSINKASDILDSSLEHNNNTADKVDTYHFKTHSMNSPNEGFTDSESVCSDNYHDNLKYINFQNDYYFDDYEEPPVFTGRSYASMARKPKAETQQYLDVDLGSKKVRVRHDSWHMVISPKPNRFYCMVCKLFDHARKKQAHCAEIGHLSNLDNCRVVEAYEEYFIRQVDDKLYHCGHCNNLQLIHEMEDHVESNHPRKTRLVTDTKNAKVKLDSDVGSPVKTDSKPPNASTPVKSENRPPNFDSPVKIDSRQPSVNTAVKNVNRPPNFASPVKMDGRPPSVNTAVKNENIPPNFGSPVKTDSRPPSVNAVKTELNVNSPVKQQNVKELNGANLYYTNNQISAQRNAANFSNIPIFNKNIDSNNSNNGLTHRMPGLFDNVVIFPFGYKITVPCLAYNIINKRPTDYYCGLCDLVCPEGVIHRHIYDVRHLEKLQTTPFIAPFNHHLIRAIREALHCAICNIPITAALILVHIQDPQHIGALNKAINPDPKPKLPPIGVKIPHVPEKITPEVKNVNYPTSPMKFPNVTPTNINKKYELNIDKVQIVKNKNTEEFIDKNKVQNTKESATDKKINSTKEEKQETEEVDEEVEEFERTFDSIASEDATLDLEEHVYLKLRNSYIKVSNTSYNTLVHIGDGSRYCFVCSVQVHFAELQKHVDMRTHLENIEKYMFLDKYEDHLLRQIYLKYHCAICNIILSRKELKSHLEWPTHALQNLNLKNIKKTRKTEIKGGVKQIVVSTQKENIYLHENECKIKVILNAEMRSESKTVENQARKNKIIIFNDNVLKLSWDAWHAVCKVKNGYKCNLCQRELKEMEVDVHCNSEWHRYSLDKPIEKQYAPALIRKINESTLNCLFCNTELSNKENLVQEHVNGKKHAKNYEAVLKDSSQANTYTDCHEDVLTIG